MDIRRKILLILGATWLVILLLISYLSIYVILGSYAALDKKQMQINLERSRAALLERTESAKKLTVDWANWDASYRFIQDKNQQFIHENMSEPTFADAGLNFILFYNPQQQFVFGKYYSLDRKQFDANVPHSLLNAIQYNTKLLELNASSQALQGFIKQDNNYVIISAAPLLTSQRQGPMRGTIMTGSCLSKDQMTKLIGIAKLPIQLISLEAHTKAEFDHINSISTHLAQSYFYVENTSPTSMAGYYFLKDIQDNPIALVKIELPRTFYLSGKKSIYYYTLIMLVAGLLIGALVWLMLKRVVLDRLFSLKKQLQHISDHKLFSQTTTIEGTDEINQIATSVNQLLDVIQKDKKEVQEKLMLVQKTNQLLENEIQQRLTVEVELRSNQSQLDYLAHHDALTNLPNSTLFNELLQASLQKALRNKRRIAVLFIDLDNFKLINDTYGHKAGDLYLKALTAELKTRLRKSDVLCRLGGDEFLLYTIEDNGFDPEILAKKILAIVTIPQDLQDAGTIQLSASIGISIFPDDANTAQELQRTADLAMYEAKKLGKNRFVLYRNLS